MQIFSLFLSAAISFVGSLGSPLEIGGRTEQPFALAQQSFRDFTFDAETSGAVAGFLTPGDWVEVYWTDGKEFKEIHPGLLVVSRERVEVWPESYVPITLTVVADQETAEKITKAKETGRVLISLTIPDG